MDCNGSPYHLYAGYGFGYLFYEKYLHTDLQHGYDLLKRTFYMASFGIIILMGIWYAWKRKKIDYRIFLLASFKIYLTVFLAFIMIPYLYLVVTASFVSIALFAEQVQYSVKEPEI